MKEKINWKVVWQLLLPYWRSNEKWRARGLLFVIIALALGMVYLNVLFNSWNRDMFNALQEKNFEAFKSLFWRFSYLAFIFVSISIYKVYLNQALEMRWRAWLTNQYLDKWLAKQAFYHIEQRGNADNPDQRIAEDLNSLTAGTLSLSLGLLSNVVTLVSFIGILWSVSGPLSFALAGRQWFIPGYMVWFAIAYAAIGSLLVWKIGKPLVEQNFNQQRFEANFRFGLIRIREYAEAIVLYRGERQEHSDLGDHFERIRANWWAIMRTTKRLNIVSTFYAQLAIIFPMLVAAPRYFSGAITLGVFTQISDAFGQVQDALSWFVNAFTSLADWKASVNRLAEFHQVVMTVHDEEAGITVSRNNVGAILIDNLSLRLPSRQSLSHALTTDLQAGQRILVAGPSGCGKSTLFRAMAGIWPYGAGSIEIPIGLKLLFLPQKSYLPIGTLRAAVSYPAADNAYKDLAIQHYLELCRLKHLIPWLAETDNWSQRLSPGEQQRLAFVRALLARPDVLFLDEATSALDTETEAALYNLILQELPQAALISIAHREAVVKYHQVRWQFTHGDKVLDETAPSLDNLVYKIEITTIGKVAKGAAGLA